MTRDWTGRSFRERLHGGLVALGVAITFSDPTVTELLGSVLDFVWIDMEHGALTIETVQAHVMAAQLAGAVPLVRVAWNDPVLIKQALDVGAAGIIAPMVRTAAEAQQLVRACRYPPAGIRSFGPRRPSRYGRVDGPSVCRAEDDNVFVVAQIEHVDAVAALDAILEVPGLDSLVLGPNDLSASMGLPAQRTHPKVLDAITSVVTRAHARGMLVGIGAADEPQEIRHWVAQGARWSLIGADFGLLAQVADRKLAAVRQALVPVASA